LHGLAAAHVRDAIVVSTIGRAGRGPTILYVNSAFTRMTGYSESEVLGRSFSLLAGPKTNRVALQVLNQRFCRGESFSVELIAYGKDGHEFLLEWHASPIVAGDGNVHHVASIQRDITEERSVERALRRADRDTLTGLPTRALLEKRIRHSIGRSKERTDYRFALLFLDMDGFKAVNDEHGHVVGDQLLASAARRLEGTIRPGDALARFGGDEFVILLHYVTDISDVVMVAERVRECMAAPFEIQGTSLTVAASIGIALSSSGYDHPEEVIRDADSAMYEAKRKGRGRVEFFGRSPDGSLEPTLQLQ
jgi:diguanylate cyclase (GGDEF)-like protein/PAS domain S-box-containing protein